MASTDKKTKGSGDSGLSLTKLYLAAYNGLSALGWSYLLYLAVEPIVHGGVPNSTKDLLKLASSTYTRAGPATAFVQSCAALEVVHVLLGWVRSPVVTTAMQVASRLFLVWGVTELFPSVCVSLLEKEKQVYKCICP
jgi:very-long-chain (3R)-3-hydroxyacyl-CoA dehydratase